MASKGRIERLFSERVPSSLVFPAEQTASVRCESRLPAEQNYASLVSGILSARSHAFYPMLAALLHRNVTIR
jgi:hypothetical protein